MDFVGKVVFAIIENSSLWEFIMVFVVLYIFLKPGLLERITKLKLGDLEVELGELKKQVAKGTEKIEDLESELENEKRQFEELINSFDASDTLDNLTSVRQAIRAQAANLEDLSTLKAMLTKDASPEQLYAAAVSVRERRPVTLFMDTINLLGQLADDKDLHGFRLNTVWMLTSAVHKMLISMVKDGVKPMATQTQLQQAVSVLNRLNVHPRVLTDRPDKPMKGIRGPVKYSLDWIEKIKTE